MLLRGGSGPGQRCGGPATPEVEALQGAGQGSNCRVAYELNERRVLAPNGGIWTHTTVAR
jgi:hypothetical protein